MTATYWAGAGGTGGWLVSVQPEKGLHPVGNWRVGNSKSLPFDFSQAVAA